MSPPPVNGGAGEGRFNALTHGITRSVALLEDEDAAAFAHLLQSLRAEWDVSGPTGESLVERLAETLWRMDRATLADAALFAPEADAGNRGEGGAGAGPAAAPARFVQPIPDPMYERAQREREARRFFEAAPPAISPEEALPPSGRAATALARRGALDHALRILDGGRAYDYPEARKVLDAETLALWDRRAHPLDHADPWDGPPMHWSGVELIGPFGRWLGELRRHDADALVAWHKAAETEAERRNAAARAAARRDAEQRAANMTAKAEAEQVVREAKARRAAVDAAARARAAEEGTETDAARGQRFLRAAASDRAARIGFYEERLDRRLKTLVNLLMTLKLTTTANERAESETEKNRAATQRFAAHARESELRSRLLEIEIAEKERAAGSVERGRASPVGSSESSPQAKAQGRAPAPDEKLGRDEEAPGTEKAEAGNAGIAPAAESLSRFYRKAIKPSLEAAQSHLTRSLQPLVGETSGPGPNPPSPAPTAPAVERLDEAGVDEGGDGGTAGTLPGEEPNPSAAATALSDTERALWRAVALRRRGAIAAAIEILAAAGPSAYPIALAHLDDDLQRWWAARVAGRPARETLDGDLDAAAFRWRGDKTAAALKDWLLRIQAADARLTREGDPPAPG
jgi:hypothetical protein